MNFDIVSDYRGPEFTMVKPAPFRLGRRNPLVLMALQADRRFQLKHIPDWPAMMKRLTVCAYLDLSVAEFEREVASGHLPPGVLLGRYPHWSRKQIDEYMEQLTGTKVGDWRAYSALYNPEIEAAQKAERERLRPSRRSKSKADTAD